MLKLGLYGNKIGENVENMKNLIYITKQLPEEILNI